MAPVHIKINFGTHLELMFLWKSWHIAIKVDNPVKVANMKMQKVMKKNKYILQPKRDSGQVLLRL